MADGSCFANFKTAIELIVQANQGYLNYERNGCLLKELLVMRARDYRILCAKGEFVSGQVRPSYASLRTTGFEVCPNLLKRNHTFSWDGHFSLPTSPPMSAANKFQLFRWD